MLEVRNQSNTSRFLKTVQDVTNQLSNSTKYFKSAPISNFEKSDGLRGVIELWAKTSDITVAISITNLLEDDGDKSYMRYVVSKIQAEDGDIAGAQKTADLIQNKGVKDRAQQTIAEAQAKVGSTTMRQPTSDAQPQAQRTITVSDWLVELGIYDYGSTRGIFPVNLNEAPFLDLTSHLLSLKASLPSKIAHENLQDEIYRRSEAKIYFDGIYETAKQIVKAQNVITGMLKQQAKK